MTLAVGTQLGAFEITGTLGKGGMGEVWRARDTKLGRDVAIKTLPASLADDADRLARFEREAKLLATLNHAHIASVFSLDETDGTLYIAMELVEGETLEERLKSGPIPLEDALQFGLQIATALEAAHEKSVVHRDLKPANIMLTPDGVVKVLDFGLAKAFSGDPNEASPAHSPALSIAMTQQGLILGTAGYMSPEQASGQATDQRADIWAFGVVVYEMLTGQPLFAGESVPHILADVLRADPDWSRLPDNLHPRIRLMLERCLTKKPRERYHAIADARIDIETALRDPAGLTPARPVDAAPGSRPVLARVAAGAALLIIGAAAALLIQWISRPAEDVPVVGRFAVTTPPDYPFQVNYFSQDLVITPDGRRIVYAGGPAGFVSRALDSFEATRLPLAAVGANPFISPDNEWIGFLSPQLRALVRARLSGGPEIAIASFSGGGSSRGATWLETGDIIFSIFSTGKGRQGLWRVPSGGGEQVQITEADSARNERLHIWPSSLPGGNRILFTIRFGSDADAEASTTSTIAMLDLTTGEQRRLIEGGSDARYVPTGHIVYGFDNTLRAVPFDPDSLEVTGDPVSVLDGVITTATGAADFSFAGNGTMVYAAGIRPGDLAFPVGRLTPEGDEEILSLSPRLYGEPALSPDQTRLALVAGGDIYIWSFETGNEARLTFDAGNQSRPVWSPDGQRVLYQSERQQLLARAASGAGTPELVYVTDADFITPYSWLKDGRIIVGLESMDGASDIALLTPDDEPRLEMLVVTPARETTAALSPDGRFLAYESDESGEPQIYVRPFPEVDGGRWQVSTGGGRQPAWSGDGTRLFFLDERGIMASDVSTEPTFERGLPGLWRPGTGYRLDFLVPASVRSYDVAADGEFMVAVKRQGTAANEVAPQIIVVTNWFEELKRLVPVELPVYLAR